MKTLVSTRRGALSKFPAAEAVATNEHFITAILVYLPARSVIRFKSVSKQWRSIISTSYFSGLHTQCNPNYVRGLFFQNRSPSDPEFEYISFDGNHARIPSIGLHLNVPNVRFLHSCNGLLLCFSMTDNKFTYYVCNPTTKQFRILVPPTCILNRLGVLVCLAYEPSESPHYKVVCVWESKLQWKTSCYHIVIYSSKSSSWRPSAYFSAQPGISFQIGAFSNSANHWLCTPSDIILYFHVQRECLETIETRRYCYVYYFGEARGRLYIALEYIFWPDQICVLEMELDYSRWSEKCWVDLRDVKIALSEIVDGDEWFILSNFQEEKEEEWATVFSIPDKIVSYNLKFYTI